MDTYQLSLPERADDRLEALLARETCPQHPGTTLDGGDCPMCALTQRAPVLSPFVIAAMERRLPGKALSTR